MERFEILSVWEVAHRWHDVDQDGTDAKNLPTAVKETLRELMYALNVYLNAYGAQGEFVEREYLWPGLPKTKFAKRLEAHLNAGTYDKEFLRATFIRRDELPKWCRGQNIALPLFWYPEAVVADTQHSASLEMPRPKEPNKAIVDAPDPAIAGTPGPKDTDNAKTDTSAKARRAALKRHEPIQKIKNDLYEFWDAGRFPSQAEAVRRFISTRTEESLRPLSPTNAKRTLNEALTKHVQSKRKR